VNPNIVLPALTSALGFWFVALLFARWSQRRSPALFAWGLGVLWYAIAAACEALGGLLGWNPMSYRIWYLTGAVGVAAYLGAGTVYLHREPGFRSFAVVCVLLASAPALATGHLLIGFLAIGAATVATLVLSWKPARFGDAIFALLLVATVAAAIRILFLAPVDTALLPTSPDQIVSGQALDPESRAVTPPLNLSGAVLLVAGAAASALHFARTRDQPTRVLSNVLIAVGAFIPSLASGLTRFGYTSVFFVGELLGLLCILAGFLLSGRPASANAESTSRLQPGRDPVDAVMDRVH
jgi:hypothetical protein